MTLLFDENMTPKEVAELEEAEAVCRRFLQWDIENFDLEAAGQGGVKAKLAEILGIDAEI